MTYFNRYRTKGNPYNRKRVEKAGLSFDSKFESRIHDELLLQEKAGLIDILKLQDRVHLIAGIHLIVDFKVLDKQMNRELWIEAKGFETSEWRMKKKLWKVFGPGCLRIYYSATKIEEIHPGGK